MGDVGRPLRPIAPRTIPPGGPGGNQPPGGGPSDEGKLKRASTACKECQKRRTRCSGAPPACTECQAHSRECIFDEGSDKRRKGSYKRLEEETAFLRGFVETLLDSIRAGDDPTVGHIIDVIRTRVSIEEIGAVVQEIRNAQTVHATDPPPPTLDPMHDHMGHFFDPR